MKTTSDYRGCEVDSANKTMTIPLSEFKLNVSPNDVCVNEQVSFYIYDTVNVGRYRHIWYFGDGSIDTVNYSGTHSYTDVINDGKMNIRFQVDNMCRNNDSASVSVKKVMADFNRGETDNDVSGCAPKSVQFYNTSLGSNQTYTWDFGDGSQQQVTTNKDETIIHEYTNPGNVYTVTLAIDGGLCKDDKKKTISTYPKPTLGCAPQQSICQDSMLIIRLSPNTGSVVLRWQENASIMILDSNNLRCLVKPDSNTVYVIESEFRALDGSVCSSVDSIKVKVQKRPVYTGAPFSPLILLMDDKEIELKKSPKDQVYAYTKYNLNNDTLPGVIYKWEPSEGLSCGNCASPDMNISKSMTYILLMTDSVGCFEETVSVSFKVLLETLVDVPTAFTPNGDGSNELALPRGWGVKEFLIFRIYNRWGQLVYETNEMDKGWDGTFKGEPQNQDTFAWTLEYIDVNDETQFKKGYLTLLR